MRRHRFLSLVLFGLFLFLSVPAVAGSLTITTTAQQDAALTILLAQRNAERQKQGTGPLTVEEYIQIEAGHILNQTVERGREAVKAALMRAIESGDSTIETDMRKVLNTLK